MHRHTLPARGATLRAYGYAAVIVVALFQLGVTAVAATTAAVTAVSLLDRLVHAARGGTVSPLIAWEVGFFLIVAREVWQPGPFDLVARSYADAYPRAVALLCGCHALIVLVADAVSRRSPRARAETRAGQDVADRGRPGMKLLLALSAIVIVALFWAPDELRRGLDGRVGTRDLHGVSVLSTIGFATALALPTLIAYEVIVRRGRPLWLAYLLASPIIAITFLSGTRYYLLFAAGGPVALAALRHRGDRRYVLRLLAVAGMIGVGSLVMLQFRTGGLLAQDWQLLSPSSWWESTPTEGVVAMTTKMITLFEYADFRGGQSLLAVSVVWIPSVLWPEKPPLLGWWLPRAVGDSGFSAGHSASSAYVGEGYTDFGLAGAYLWAALIGIAVGMLARLALASNGSSPWSVLGALSYPAVFFAVRSPVTSGIILAGAIGWIAMWSAATARAAKQAPTPVEAGGPGVPQAGQERTSSRERQPC